MDNTHFGEATEERLIVAGMRELEEHGLNDFSLRRVANACEVSCAAPYRHFRDKEHFIAAIIAYINRRWELIAKQIIDANPDPGARLIALFEAQIRFWLANDSFRAVFWYNGCTDCPEQAAEYEKMDRPIKAAAKASALACRMTEEQGGELYSMINVMIYGAVPVLIGRDAEYTDRFLKKLSTLIAAELDTSTKDKE